MPARQPARTPALQKKRLLVRFRNTIRACGAESTLYEQPFCSARLNAGVPMKAQTLKDLALSSLRMLRQDSLLLLLSQATQPAQQKNDCYDCGNCLRLRDKNFAQRIAKPPLLFRRQHWPNRSLPSVALRAPGRHLRTVPAYARRYERGRRPL